MLDRDARRAGVGKHAAQEVVLPHFYEEEMEEEGKKDADFLFWSG